MALVLVIEWYVSQPGQHRTMSGQRDTEFTEYMVFLDGHSDESIEDDGFQDYSMNFELSCTCRLKVTLYNT